MHPYLPTMPGQNAGLPISEKRGPGREWGNIGVCPSANLCWCFRFFSRFFFFFFYFFLAFFCSVVCWCVCEQAVAVLPGQSPQTPLLSTMSVCRHFVVLLLLVNFSLAKVCSSEGIVPFTGFKFTRTYRISVYPMTGQRAIVVTQCKTGRAILSRTIEINSEKDLDFDTVFGFRFDDPRLLNHSGPTVQLQVSQQFKIARRRLYAKLNLVYFLPYTFVGGLFRCEESLADTIDPCDPAKSVPVGPLVADDSSKHWMSLLRHPLGIAHNVPYLRTASRWDPRFPRLIAWETAVDVNENYNYDKLELRLVSMALANTANYVHKLTRFPTFTRGILLQSKNDSLGMSGRLSLFLSSLDAKKRFFHIGNLQGIWDNVFQQ